MADNVRKVKVAITGYYEIEMDEAEADYTTTDPDKMLEIDTAGLKDILKYSEVDYFLGNSVDVVLSWEN